jgi:hypothetical protein
VNVAVGYIEEALKVRKKLGIISLVEGAQGFPVVDLMMYVSVRNALASCRFDFALENHHEVI